MSDSSERPEKEDDFSRRDLIAGSAGALGAAALAGVGAGRTVGRVRTGHRCAEAASGLGHGGLGQWGGELE